MLSHAAVQDFKQLYTDEFGEELSDEEALQIGTSLLTLLNHTYRPITKQEEKEYLSSHSESYSDSAWGDKSQQNLTGGANK